MKVNPFVYKCVDEIVVEPEKLIDTITKLHELGYAVELSPRIWKSIAGYYGVEYTVKLMKPVDKEVEE